MWKSVFLAMGIFACVVGAEMLVIDSALVLPVDGAGPAREVTAPDWCPWVMISAGAVTLLHFGTGSGSASGSSGSQGMALGKQPSGKFPHL